MSVWGFNVRFQLPQGRQDMAFYSAYAPPGAMAHNEHDAERVAFVRDGFAWGAFVFGFIWLFLNRCWLAGTVVLAATVVLSAAGELAPRFADACAIVGLLLAAFVGLEANGWRAASLERRGYRLVGVASGDGRADCERRIFEQWLADPAAARSGAAVKVVPPAPRHGVVGVFPERAR